MKSMPSHKIILSFFICCFVGTSHAQTVLGLSDSTEVIYQISGLSQDARLIAISENPDNKQFITKFDSLYGQWFDKKKQYVALLNTNVDDWEIGLYDTRNEQLKFLANYEKSLSDDFKIIIKQSIEWNYWHLLLAYPILRSNAETDSKRMISLPRIMTKDLKLEVLKNDDYLALKTYRSFLAFAITYFNSAEQNFVKYADRTKLVKDKTEFAAKLLSNSALDYYSAFLINENCPYLTPSSARYFISNIYNSTVQKKLLNVCQETLNRKEVVEDKTKKPVSKNSNYPALMDLNDKPFDFSAYKGKVIYVDFWASWCGPCRAEFPKSKEMHETLTDKQKKEIVFLYISIDDDLAAWKNAVEKLNLKDSGENGHSFEAARRYNVKSIPRYMIINQKGEIVEQEATRPSNPETLKSLLKLLE